MNHVVIENPINNSPFDEPNRHFLFTDKGITNEIVDGRPIGLYFAEVAKKCAVQRIDEVHLVWALRG
jgi:type III restriction enzyme